ncbi:hypothetical protein V8E51_015884 [Hyaloscypha variabilis]
MTKTTGVVRRLARNAANLFRRSLEIFHPRDSPLAIEYDMEWEVPKFLSSCFAEGQELGKVLTVTGSAIDAQAQSCAEYLTQKWPQIGPLLLDGLHANVFFDIKVNSNVVSESLTSNATIVVLATHTLHHQTASALSWISAAVRHSSYENVTYSSISISANTSNGANPRIAICLEELQPLYIEEPCWHPLLPYAVIAKGFPIRERTEGKGLEISFADMALLSQSMSFTEYNRGLIVEGLRSVLISMKTLPQDDAIQWHLEHKRHQRLPKQTSVSEILASDRFADWYKTQAPAELTEKRCFLGWAEDVAVVIGTAEYSNTNTYYSGSLPAPKTRNVKINSISMEASGFGLFGARSSKSWYTTSVPSKITLELDKDIYDTLADEYYTNLMIYDTEGKISWLLPQPSVLLYMTHKIITRRRYRLFYGEKEADFLFASPVADGAAEADSTLRKLLQIKVQKNHDFKECLSRTVRQVLLLLDQVGDGLKLASTELEPTGSAAKGSLYGVEFNDVLEMRSSIDIKQANVEQPWTQMVRDGSVVLFCAGLSQPIVSMSPNLCTTYTMVPPLRDLMATTGRVLGSILHQNDRGLRGSRLGNTVQWIKDDNLIQSHIRGKNVTVFHEQRLRVVKKAYLDYSISDRVRRHMSGGFIFTNHRSRKACSEAVASTESATSNVAKDNPIYNNKTLPDVPEDGSGSIVPSESGSGFNNERLLTSSISNDESPDFGGGSDDTSTIPRLSGKTAIVAWGTVDNQPDAIELPDSFGERRMYSGGTSISGTSRTIRRKNRCVDLVSSVNKGKGVPWERTNVTDCT